MGRRIRVAVFLACLAVLGPGAFSEETSPDLTQPYVALDLFKQDRVQQILADAAAAGYRILDFRGAHRTGWTKGGYALLLERAADGSDAVEYEIVVRREVDRLEEALNEVATRGFRMCADGLFYQVRGAKPFQDGEFVALVERSPAARTGRHYLVLSGEDLPRAVPIAVERGYEVVGASGSPEVRLVVMEKFFRGTTAGPEPAAEDPYRVLASGGLKSMRKQLSRAAADGYRLDHAARPGGDYFVIVRARPDAPPVEYLLLSPKKLLVELEAAAAQGYRLLPWTLDSVPAMERSPGSGTVHEYRVVEDEDVASRDRKLESSIGEGFRVLRLFGDSGVILERKVR